LFDPAKGIVKMTAEELEKIWQSKALLKLVPTEKFVRKTITQSKKKEWIIGLIKEDFNILLVALILGIAISVLGISTAIFSQKLIDDILPKENIQKLFLSLVLVTLLLLARSGLGYLRGLFMIRQGMDFNNRIIQRFYNNLLQLPKSFFDTRKTGELIARMNDTRRIQSVLSVVSGSIVIDLLLVIVSLGFVFAYSSLIGFIMLGSLPVYFLILLWFNKPIIRTQKEVMSGYAVAESNFVDTMQGVADIKLMNKQSFFERINATVYGAFQQKMADLGHLNIKFSSVSEVTGFCL
jgi:ATP-binding cassette subfamily B protein